MIYNILLFKIELIFFLLLLTYIFYYLFNHISWIIISIKELISIKKNKKDITPTIVEVEKESYVNEEEFLEQTSEITQDEKYKISDLLRKIRINISKKEYDLAQNLIVEWLAIDKFNIDLNIELASLYIMDKDYTKAEFIYKDLLLIYNENYDLLKKLGYILSLQEKYDLSLEVYKKAYELNPEDSDVLNMLANICYIKNYFLETIEYLNILLKQKPRDIELLILTAVSYKNIQDYDSSILFLNKALDFDPYNENIKNEIKIVDDLKLKELENKFIPEENIDNNLPENLIIENNEILENDNYIK